MKLNLLSWLFLIIVSGLIVVGCSDDDNTTGSGSDSVPAELVQHGRTSRLPRTVHLSTLAPFLNGVTVRLLLT